MTNFETALLILYIFSVLWNMGFQLKKSESPFIDADMVFWAVAITSSLFGFFTTALIMGANYDND